MRRCVLQLFLLLLVTPVFAQDPAADTSGKKRLAPIQKFFVGGAFDGAIFSSATIKETTTLYNPGGGTITNSKDTYGKLRFSYIVNFGFTFNFNLSRHFGIYTGIDMKNIGYIDNSPGGQIVKHRAYTIGAPVGIKIGNMARKGKYMFLGGGADAPFNYREKIFEIRSQKTKFNEWFSDRTAAIMPYAFVGGTLPHGIALKVQYYPGNFMNPDFTKNGIQPYKGTEVHLILISLGITPNFSKHHDIVETKVAELKTT